MKIEHRSPRRRLGTALAALTTLVLVPGCARPTRCTVENRSASTLTHVVLSGAGFTAPVPDLAPGASAAVSLRPRGEAGHLGIVFEAAGREHRHSKPVYFEARGYAVVVRVDPRFEVTVQVNLATPARSRPETGA